MRHCRTVLFLLALTPLSAQEVRPKDVREIAKAGSSAIPRLQALLKNPSLDVRIETVKQITEIGTQYSIDPLVLATQDNDPEVQIRATDGLVNFYLPGYVQNGFGASLRRVGTGIKGKFTDTNDQVVDPFVIVRPEVVVALGGLARGGGSMEVRANAARAIGILRGKAAVPDLIEATHSKNTDVIYESLVALQKIRDESVSARVTFLLHDLDPKVQIAAIETTGLLRNTEAVPDLVDVLNHARDAKVKRMALTAIAMLPNPNSRSLYQQYLHDKDDKMRAAAAEGYARLKTPADLPMLEKAWADEGKTSPRLSLAFAQVMLGKTGLSEFSPLQYLINSLNSAAYKGEALPFLVEAARDNQVRASLYRPLQTGTKDEKIGLLGVLSRSGDRASIPEVQKLTTDPDPEVAREALRAQRTLQARF
ncbi:MAG TPA: HEAT repeat domain-containing protein [Bryobacteraceae bacterium]|jgi:HEAT repeat protein|nr:HEAT repeat domain-containing protein [Bryobacteraceae bacterium]